MKDQKDLAKFWKEHNKFTFTGFIQEKLLNAFIEKHNDAPTNKNPLIVTELCHGRLIETSSLSIVFETLKVTKDSSLIKFTGKTSLPNTTKEVEIHGQFELIRTRHPSGYFSISKDEDFEEFVARQADACPEIMY